jgi:hypothetical protein
MEPISSRCRIGRRALARRLHEAARGPKRPLLVEGVGHRWVAFRAIGAIFEQLRELTARVQ